MRWWRFLYAVTGLVMFVVSIQLIGRSVQVLAPLLEDVMRVLIDGELSAMGVSWFAAYVFLSGAPAGAVTLAMYTSELLTLPELFMAMSGSRLGAAFIVVLIGAFAYLRGSNDDLRDACSIGVLGFLVTFAVYIPAIAVGRLSMEVIDVATLTSVDFAVVHYSVLAVIEPVTAFIVGAVPGPVALAIGFIALVASLEVFDMAFSDLHASQFEQNYFRYLLSMTWVSFAVGLVISLLTMSVSISLGLIVPLYNAGYIKRKDIIPYMMGANVTTLGERLIAATVLDTVPGFNVVLLLTITVTMVSVAALLVYDRFYAVIKEVFDAIMSGDRLFWVFIAFLLVFPAVLVAL